MGTSVLPYRYRINGLIDTSRTAIDNLELIGNSCATWITYDVQDGKWAVVINRAGNSVFSFNDDNIIGSIKLNGTGLIDQYNGVEVRFPHRDLNDQEDFIRIEIPTVDRLPNEPDNILFMDLPVMNEPIQAQIVGLIELKQARLDKIITFQSDYSKINLQAGNIIDVTNSVYGWTNKEFRIIRMEETDVDGAIVIEITALEYDDNVYSLDDLYRYTRTTADGILTQGALGKPTTPTCTKFEAVANPRVEISSITPDNTDPLNQAGIIEAMEFWISTDGTNYTLVATQRPTPALTYAANTTVTFAYNNVNTSFYVKTRCSNSTTTSEFSSPASVIFAPVQVTDAIKEDTTGLLNIAGGSISTSLALTALLKGLDTYMNGNSNLANSVGSQISSANSTGFALVYDDLETGANVAVPSTFGNIANNIPYGYYYQSNIGSFTASTSSRHICDVYYNCGNSNAIPSSVSQSVEKYALTIIKSGGYYNGSVGAPGDILGDVTANIVTTSGVQTFEVSNNLYDAYTDINQRFTGNLVLGTTYYVSSFFSVEPSTDRITKVITVQTART
jgi:hypothetical protein